MTVWNQVVELAGWGMDEEPDRERYCDPGTIAQSQADAERLVRHRPVWKSVSPIVPEAARGLAELLKIHTERADFQREFSGLEWQIQVMDLRRLISFQRRLVLPDEGSARPDSGPVSWLERVDLAFPSERKSGYEIERGATELVLRSANPDFRVRLEDRLESPERCSFRLEHGSPFMEVAHYGGRWFLRDGYHRASRLMRVGVFEVPAVVIEARTLQELGAAQRWFFAESTLFSDRPPAVMDFCEDNLILQWRRPARRKVIRIAVSDSFETMPVSLREEKEHEYCNDAR
jgi:hypothetical protein